MKLEYKILWFENDENWVEPVVENISDFLEEKGFILTYVLYDKSKKIDYSLYDLILIDYNLENNEHGHDIIEQIRNEEVLTEILFYSASGGDTIRKVIANDKRVDGVYCSDRSNVIEKSKKVIYTTIRKTQDLNNLRGLVMAETSELDQIIKDIIAELSIKDQVEYRRIERRIEKKIEDYEDGMRNVLEIDNFGDFIDSSHFNANFALSTLNNFSKCSKNQINRQDFKDYKSDIIDERNVLAHQPESEEDGELTIKGKAYDNEEFIRIRKKIREYKDIFVDIKKAL